MLYLQVNTVNTVVLTLQEKATLAAPVYYLFVFTSDDTNDTKIFTGVDTSTNLTRYNRFDIEITTGTENLLNSVINMEPNGFWKYTIYEMSSSTNLDPALCTSVVETGKVYLQGPPVPTTTEYTPDSDTKYYYKG